MFGSFLLLCLHLLSEIEAAEQLQAPAELNCPALHVGLHVITDHSCSSGSVVPGTSCSFTCPKGYKLIGPPKKQCQMDGSWTDEFQIRISCVDENECDISNGFCSHICKNTVGSYQCACPAPFYLDKKDQRTCKARGVKLSCEPNHIEIVLPKNLIHNLAHEHLSLLDHACKASGNATHYILSTAVTECGTTSHVYKNFIVYTNRVLESPDKNTDVITKVGENEITIPFSCYFNDLEIVHAVGFKPVAEKIHVYVKGRGNYALSLDIFKDKTYGEGLKRALTPSLPKYTQADFPISVHLRERVYVQASLDTRETDLKIFLSNCCSTPMQDHEATMKFRHALIVNGCPRDPSVQFHPSSDPTKVRFSFEMFQFLGGHDYVFIHCRIHVCDVNDKDSRCAKGCINSNSSMARDFAETNEKSAAQSVSEKQTKKTSTVHEQNSAPNKLSPEAKTSTLQAATRKKLTEKPKAQSKGERAMQVLHNTLLKKDKKAHEAKLPAQKNGAAASHRIMKRATERSFKKGVLGTVDVSKGPFILEIDERKEKRRMHRLGKMFAHAKANGIKQDVKEKSPHKRSSAVPSASDLLLVALAVASIMTLAGVAYLGRKAMKIAKNPYNYETLVVN